ncbi:hypothetical protein [Jeotgalibacillus marinus]|uniref:Uncharacterized protein n=1 Tax=Jeotgalibacillus marinus TaxID=86667 RepID=A0ABV3Q379_9BACL
MGRRYSEYVSSIKYFKKRYGNLNGKTITYQNKIKELIKVHHTHDEVNDLFKKITTDLEINESTKHFIGIPNIILASLIAFIPTFVLAYITSKTTSLFQYANKLLEINLKEYEDKEAALIYTKELHESVDGFSEVYNIFFYYMICFFIISILIFGAGYYSFFRKKSNIYLYRMILEEIISEKAKEHNNS